MSSPSPPMPRRSTASRPRPALRTPALLAGLAALPLLAAAWRIGQESSHRLWLDELYTVTLIDTPSLAHVWNGALRGVDGNPPLYLTLCWALSRLVGGDAERMLEPLNLAFLSGTAVLLYRIGRRLADPLCVAAGLLVLGAIDGMVVYALLEIRTYALYLLLVTATLAASLRVVDRPTPGRTAALAGLGVLATLSHSFGGFYALTILGAAATVALANRDPARAAAVAVAGLTVAVALAIWLRVSLPAQLAVATPYGWIPVPDAGDLAVALTGAVVPTALVGAGTMVLALRRGVSARRALRLCRERPDVAAIWIALAGFAALTVAGWIGSHLATPFFVPRYFIPNLLLAALPIACAISAVRRRLDRGLFAVAVAVCLAACVTAIAAQGDEERRAIPCQDEAGRFIEDGLARDGTPVIADSPQAWLPRAHYAPDQITLFPLDWGVVLRHPTAARNNAMDFHIMEILRDWAAPGSAPATRVMTTEAILGRYRHMLVLAQDTRSWFAELRATVPLSARLLGEVGHCHLWDVTLEPPRVP